MSAVCACEHSSVRGGKKLEKAQAKVGNKNYNNKKKSKGKKKKKMKHKLPCYACNCLEFS